MNCNLPSSFCPCDFPGKNTGVCCRCHFLLQGIFLTQGLNPNLLHWQAKSLPLSHLGSRGRELQSAALIRDCFCCSSMEPFPFRVDSQLAFAWESLTLTLDSVSSLIPLSPYPKSTLFLKEFSQISLAWALRDLLFSCQVMYQLFATPWTEHTRLPCPSLSPGVCSDSSPLKWRCHPIISFSVIHLSSCPQSFSASRSFPMSWLFASGGQSIGASASVLPMSIQVWFPLGLTGLISLLSKGLSRVSSRTIIQKH